MYGKLTFHNRPSVLIRCLQNANRRLSPALQLIKYKKMVADPYSFFRGSAQLFWFDFYQGWYFTAFGGLSNTQTWLCGDSHVYNFGAFSDPKGNVYYGIDDFDDSIVGDFQYDLWRLSVSLFLDVEANQATSNFSVSDTEAAIKSFAEGYINTLSSNKWNPRTDRVVFTSKSCKGPLKKFLKSVEEDKGRNKMLKKWTDKIDGERVLHAKKLDKLPTNEFQELEDAVLEYVKRSNLNECVFTVKDMASRFGQGLGSLGVQRYYCLIDAGDEHSNVILDIKEQLPPAAVQSMSEYELELYHQGFVHEGARFVTAFNSLTDHPDPYVGFLEFGDVVFSVKERSPFKSDFDTSKLKSRKEFQKVAKWWGRILAVHHRRGAIALGQEPGRFEEDVLKRVEKKGDEFVELLVNIGASYAQCVNRDYASFKEHVSELDSLNEEQAAKAMEPQDDQ